MDVVFIKVNTTGTSMYQDKICEIGIVKKSYNSITEYSTLVNPMMQIPEAATSLHGITNEMVADAPIFKDIADEVKSFIGNAAISGYNSNKFDLPILMEEYNRLNIVYPPVGTTYIDTLIAYRKVNKSDLYAVYKSFFGQQIERYNAVSDAHYTMHILDEMINQKLLPENPIDLEKVIDTRKKADLCGYLRYDHNNKLTFAFGEYDKKPISEKRTYAEWMLKKNFPADTKQLIYNELKNTQL